MVKTYKELREETSARDRSLHEKVVSLSEAAALVGDGDHVAIGGCTMSRTPIAMIWALIRARRKDLVVSRSISSTEGGRVEDVDLVCRAGNAACEWDAGVLLLFWTPARFDNSESNGQNQTTCRMAFVSGRRLTAEE